VKHPDVAIEYKNIGTLYIFSKCQSVAEKKVFKVWFKHSKYWISTNVHFEVCTY